jgi:hypothetical protein
LAVSSIFGKPNTDSITEKPDETKLEFTLSNGF